MAATSTVGATKYGMQLTFRNSGTQTSTTKSYNGLNFPNESAVLRATTVKDFLYGKTASNTGLAYIMVTMQSPYDYEGSAITATNNVEITGQ